MALTDESNGMVMPVAPMYGGGYGNGGFGNFDGDWGWIVLLLLLAGGGGWGLGGFGGFGGMMGMGMADGMFLYPWMNQAEITTNGFQNMSTQNQLTAVQSDLGDIQTQLCNGFAGVNATVNSGFANAETANNARQIANMQQAFATQTAITSGINGLSSQFADCCCENRLASANLQNVIQTENCADRAAISDGIRDLLTATQAQTQAILDKMCQQEIEAKNETIANLRTQVNMQNLAASQAAQTAALIQDNNGQTRDLIQRIAPYPVPSYNVANPYAYNGCGCGCGCNS